MEETIHIKLIGTPEKISHIKEEFRKIVTKHTQSFKIIKEPQEEFKENKIITALDKTIEIIHSATQAVSEEIDKTDKVDWTVDKFIEVEERLVCIAEVAKDHPDTVIDLESFFKLDMPVNREWPISRSMSGRDEYIVSLNIRKKEPREEVKEAPGNIGGGKPIEVVE